MPSSPSELSSDDRRLALLLSLPAFGLSLCLATLSTYLPVLAHRFTDSTTTIGLLVGGEGVIAVALPIWIGRLSDRTHTRWGPRLPFMVATAPIAMLALVLLPFAPSLLVMAVEVFAFYVAFFGYFSPYRALYPDLISRGSSARAQGIQGVANGVGLGVALVGGGFFLAIWRPLPYLLAAVSLAAVTFIVVAVLRNRASKHVVLAADELSPFVELWTLLRDNRDVLRFVIGNVLLMLGLAGLKAFVVLWLTEGLERSMTFTAGAMTVVAVGTVVGALVSGRLGDRFGPGRVLAISLCVFGVGVSAGAFTSSIPLLAIAFPFIALAGGAAVTLPYALLLELTPNAKSGIVAGLFDATSGLGTLLGPTLVGLAIDLFGPAFPGSHGFGAMWPVLSVSVLGSVMLLWRVTPAHER